MTDFRNLINGEARTGLDDKHTARMYDIFAKRAESINTLIALGVAGVAIALLAGILMLTSLTIWVWAVLV